jgi:AraC-like DNA-binding protein
MGLDVFETSGEKPGGRPKFWVDAICTQILPVQVDLRHDRLPAARMCCGDVGDLRIRDVVGGDHVYRRDDADIRRGDPETVQVVMSLGGHSVMIQDGREATLSGGDMVLYDSSRPFTVVMEDQFHWQVFLLPKAKLRRSDRELAEVTAITLPGDSGMSRPVSAFLRGLAAEVPRLEDTPGAAALGETAADLIATMVRSRFGKQWDVTGPAAALREAVGSYLRDHHGDPGLGPEKVAAAHGISVRRLHALFEPTGVSVSARLREERLAAIRADLADPGLAHRSIERIAAAHGLRNASAFARLFRAAEGLTPREFRAAALRAR